MPKLINFTYLVALAFSSRRLHFLIALQHCDAWRCNDSFLEKYFHICFVSSTMKAISLPVFLCLWTFSIEIMHFNYIFFPVLCCETKKRVNGIMSRWSFVYFCRKMNKQKLLLNATKQTNGSFFFRSNLPLRDEFIAMEWRCDWMKNNNESFHSMR